MLLLLACTPSPTVEAPAPPSWGSATWAGDAPDDGYGSRIATDGTDAWISAPYACGVYRAEPGAAPYQILHGQPDTFCGAGLTAGVVGAPGDGGAVFVGGVAVATGNNVGGVVVGDGTRWVASTATGWLDSDGKTAELGARPDALALLDGEVVAGSAFGHTALWTGTVPAARVAEDQRGYALATCDTDGDGDDELVVGAPGAGTIDAGGATVHHGTGRFGAALACGEPGVLYVGAPAEGTLHQGAVYRVQRMGTPALVASGDALDELGTALAVANGHLLMGAPGPASAPGHVRVEPAP